MEEQIYYVYMLTNWNNKLLYIGVTNNLARRIHEHKNKLFPGFTKKYNINKLVYFETTNEITAAIAREKQLKRWRRNKKNDLIDTMNPDREELYDGLT
jgi:putative endonuclease